jgi:predicted phosphodiesterase
MRVAALYDIHGNLRALDAVLLEVARAAPDVILVGGDTALGPVPRETLDRLLALGARATFIRGNCDREMSAPPGTPPTTGWGARTKWATDRCSASQVRFLAGLPTTATLDVSGLGATLFCHGSPRRDDEILTRLSSDERLRAATAGFAHAVVASGHTHVQYDRRALGRRWVNPGSVGMAYEAQPGAYWALFGPDVELRCTPYDVERAIEDVRSSGFPDPDEFIGKYLLARPDPAEASAFFEKMAEGAPAS